MSHNGNVYGICKPAHRFCTRPVHPRRHDPGMDIVAVAMAITTFAILFALIYAIDRI
jgi:hypothetical protein